MTTRIDEVHATAYTIPTDQPEADGTLEWTSTTMVLVQVRSGDVTGTGWTYGAAAGAQLLNDVLAPLATGQCVFDVAALWQHLVRQVRNIGRAGVAGYAISALDCAAWDLKARLVGLPLFRLLGGARTDVPIYGSGGFTTYDDNRLTQQLTGWVRDDGTPAVKIKIGEGTGSCVDRDLARTGHARDVIGGDVALFVDANGGYSRKQAIRVARQLEQLDVTWFEEPVSSDDLAGLREVRDQTAIDVAAGEYGHDLTYFNRMCRAGAVDCLQIDASRCGGVSEWLRAAAVAASYGLQVSGHCAPMLHLHAATATPNLRHLEYFHDHVRIERLAFDGVVEPTGGVLTPDSTRPGIGVEVKWADLLPYQVA